MGFLAERQARKVIGEIYEISPREKLRSDSIRDFFIRWLERVKVETSPKTFEFAFLTTNKGGHRG